MAGWFVTFYHRARLRLTPQIISILMYVSAYLRDAALSIVLHVNLYGKLHAPSHDRVRPKRQSNLD